MNRPFQRLVHADWSVSPAKRWMAEARRSAGGWVVEAPRPVGNLGDFVEALLAPACPTLAGFDFPIGLPQAFGEQTGLSGFVAALKVFGQGDWARFYDVCERPDEIALERPFYPNRFRSDAPARHAHLFAGLKVAGMDDLRRRCEHRTVDRPAASPLFWTLGGNQVGKAAITGWREVLRPARDEGAKLWPFDGALADLAGSGGLVLCETYPAEAYRHLGLKVRSKRRQPDRQAAAAHLPARCEGFGIALSPAMTEALADGFGPGGTSEDAFDAAMGLLGMIDVADSRRPAGPPGIELDPWEGWILGQRSGGSALLP